jgi:hypothetical protein
MSLYGFLEYIITGFITYKNPRLETGKGVFGVIFIWAFWIASIVFLLLVVLYAWCLTTENKSLRSGYKMVYGYIYEDEGVSSVDKSKEAFFVVFLSQRWFYLLMIFLLSRRPCQQIQLVLFLNVLVGIYKAKTRPLVMTVSQCLDVANEWFLFFITLHMLGFTQYVQGVEAQNSVGWSMISFIIVQWVVNQAVICYYLYQVAQ